jgi:hypothetical protein
MIYSSWRPDQGGYDYFETPERRGLGDDLPTPRMAPVTALGVPSTSVGRPLAAGARLVGSGAVPVGVVTPLSRRGLALGQLFSEQTVLTGLLMAAVLTVGWLLGRQSVKR